MECDGHFSREDGARFGNLELGVGAPQDVAMPILFGIDSNNGSIFSIGVPPGVNPVLVFKFDVRLCIEFVKRGVGGCARTHLFDVVFGF